MKLDARAYTVPTEVPEADGTLDWDRTTAVVVLATEGTHTGTGYTYGPAPAASIVDSLLAPAVADRDAMDVPGAYAAMRVAARNAFTPGLVGLAISAVDAALWDLKARTLGVPLASLFGRARPDVLVYGSGGFTTLDHERTRAQLAGWVHEDGIPRVKIKIGEDRGRREDRDLSRIALAREVIGPHAELYVDANGGYTAKQAIRVAQRAARYDVRWFEEPVSSDDLAGLALVRSRVDADVAAGEYGTDPVYFRRMAGAGAVDCVQLDATRCGGYSGFLAGCAVVESFGLTVSAHCAPQLHAHIGPAIPALRHVEWFADHVRVERLLFDGVLSPAGGVLQPDLTVPGNGLSLADRAERHRVA